MNIFDHRHHVITIGRLLTVKLKMLGRLFKELITRFMKKTKLYPALINVCTICYVCFFSDTIRPGTQKLCWREWRNITANRFIRSTKLYSNKFINYDQKNCLYLNVSTSI